VLQTTFRPFLELAFSTADERGSVRDSWNRSSAARRRFPSVWTEPVAIR
jgi:hypothetical protein